MRRPPRLFATLAALLILHLLLALPPDPGALGPAALLRLPLELPLAIALLLAVPNRPVRGALSLLLTATLVVKLADLGTEIAFRRPFNPVLDGDIVAAAWRLTGGSLGWHAAFAAVLVLAAAVILAGLAAWWATGRIAERAPARRRWTAGALAPAAAALVFLDATAPAGRIDPPGQALTTRVAWAHVRDAQRAWTDLERFRLETATDGFAALPPADILPALGGTDVLVIFVESYGRSALENPLYAPTVTAALRDAQSRITTSGLALRSGYLTAPMVGGQSWLAHASVLSGLPISDQGRYRALLDSPRRTLLHLAQRGGWETAAVMPAITLAWPEADYFGYGRVLAAAELGYRGLPFNWVTMPDQFTLASLERQLLDPHPRAPVFVEVALISSHAPWTPIPPILPWDDLGCGKIFDLYATAGDPPEVVWRDRDKVREQYRLSLDYVLRIVGEFAARRAHSARPTLMVVLGDHQPATFVSGDPVGLDVPVHVIGPPHLLAHLDAWGWTPGIIPAPDIPAWPMSAFRDRFLAAFAAAPPARAGAVR